MAAKCYVCGEQAEGECLVCGKAFCPSHGNRLCAQCGEQDEVERRAEAYESLPSPFFFRGALALAILAVLLEVGWDAYRSMSGGSNQDYSGPPGISAAQNLTPVATIMATPQAQPQATPAAANPTAVPPTAVPPTVVPPTPTPGVLRYTIQVGDTLLGIAIRFGVTVEALQAANGNLDPTLLQVGKSLIIPNT
ncbi:MAG: LysM peptidoglycan-binding domain-containing protein [Dehalococcoidia bacterium]|nr:LysM peptidoglycan-binding domain-containing protein [Dehalococcoidia bacterium]